MQVVLFLALLLTWRLIYLVCVPLDLISDEAYYWDWSRRLDWGYFSKPPMIAWINAVSSSLLGGTEFGVRAPAALLGTIGLVPIYLLGRSMYNHRAGLLAMLLIAFTPGNIVMSLLMTIDAPFLFFWSVMLYAFWKALNSEGKEHIGWLILSTIAVGLGLLTKQIMLGFFACTGLFLLTGQRDRPLLLSPKLWLAAVGALSFLTPVILWNARHDWITLQHTATHFEAESAPWWESFRLSGEYVGSQLGVVSPLLWIAILVCILAGCWNVRHLQRHERYLFCFGGVPLLAIFVLSFQQHLEPNWPAAFYPAMIVWAAAAIERVSSANFRGFVFPTWYSRAALGTAFGLSVLIYLLPAVVPMTPLNGSGWDVTARLRGWRELSDAVEPHWNEFRSREQGGIISTTPRSAISSLAFYLPGQPKISRWKSSEIINNQYDLWGVDADLRSENVLLITPIETGLPEELASQFESTVPKETIEIRIGPVRKRTYQIWEGTNFRSGGAPNEMIATTPGSQYQ